MKTRVLWLAAGVVAAASAFLGGIAGLTRIVESPRAFEAIVGDASHETAEVSTAQLQEILREGTAIIIDARPREEYDLGHIPGAKWVDGKPGLPAATHTAGAARVEALVAGNRSQPIIIYCNGLHCRKTARLADDLLAAGFENVRRYQLGIPAWRALGLVVRVDPEAAARVLAADSTAVLIDARSPEAFARGSAPHARNVPPDQIIEAENDGRLPMLDHNTRVLVFADDEQAACAAAGALTKKGFHNVGYLAGALSDVQAALSER